MKQRLELVYPPPGFNPDPHHQLHPAGLQASLHGHRFQRRLADASGHGAAGVRPHGARRGRPLPVRHRRPHARGLPVLREVPQRGSDGVERRRGRHGEPAERHPVQTVGEAAEAARLPQRAARQRARGHVDELHHRGLRQNRAAGAMRDFSAQSVKFLFLQAQTAKDLLFTLLNATKRVQNKYIYTCNPIIYGIFTVERE